MAIHIHVYDSIDPSKQKKIDSLKKKIQGLQDALGLARERRRMKGQHVQGDREMKLSKQISDLTSELSNLQKDQ